MNKHALTLARILGATFLVLIVIFVGFGIGIRRVGMIRSNPYVYFDPDILFDIDRVPDYSENFDEEFISSFEENYAPDYHLGYYSASKWEAEIEEKIDISKHKYRFSLIEGVDNKEFVVLSHVSRSKFPALADVYCSLDVYRHKDAPNPMTDWTIKSVSVIALDFHEYLSSSNYETETDAKNMKDPQSYIIFEELAVKQMSLFDNADRRVCEFDRENDPALIEMIEKSYISPAKNVTPFRLTHQVDTEDSLLQFEFYIVIKFEENDNIVWTCKLERDQYYDILYFDSLKGYSEKTVIDGEYAEKIFSSIFTK